MSSRISLTIMSSLPAMIIFNTTKAIRNNVLLVAMAVSVSVVMVRAQTASFETLRNRVITVTKGLNADALSIGLDDTYQSKALLHLSEQAGVDTFLDSKLVQYYALYCIYHATNGVPNEITNADDRFENIAMPEWLIANNWRDETTIDPCGTKTTIVDTTTPSTDTDENDTSETIATTLSTTTTYSVGWHGIVCDDEGRVIAIDLFDNILSGIFPEEIVLLASSDGQYSTPGTGNLERLDLFDNEFLSNGGDSSWMSDLGSNMSKYLKYRKIVVIATQNCIFNSLNDAYAYAYYYNVFNTREQY
jgi:hypothetical protein